MLPAAVRRRKSVFRAAALQLAEDRTQYACNALNQVKCSTADRSAAHAFFRDIFWHPHRFTVNAPDGAWWSTSDYKQQDRECRMLALLLCARLYPNLP